MNEPACCHHRIQTVEYPPYWWMHPLTHTFNMFMFTFICLAFFYSIVKGVGSAENLASFMMIDSPLQVVATAVIGMISNCFVSVFLAIAYLKGVISFPAFLSGLITVTGLGLATLVKRSQNKNDVSLISIILLVVAIAVGLFVYYNMIFVDLIKEYFIS